MNKMLLNAEMAWEAEGAPRLPTCSVIYKSHSPVPLINQVSLQTR